MELSRFDRRETLSDGILVKKIKQMNNEKLKVFCHYLQNIYNNFFFESILPLCKKNTFSNPLCYKALQLPCRGISILNPIENESKFLPLSTIFYYQFSPINYLNNVSLCATTCRVKTFISKQSHVYTIDAGGYICIFSLSLFRWSDFPSFLPKS